MLSQQNSCITSLHIIWIAKKRNTNILHTFSFYSNSTQLFQLRFLSYCNLRKAVSLSIYTQLKTTVSHFQFPKYFYWSKKKLHIKTQSCFTRFLCKGWVLLSSATKYPSISGLLWFVVSFCFFLCFIFL